MKSKDIMTKDIKSCTPDCTIKEAVNIMKKLNCGVIPVVNKENILQGILTDRDIVMYSVLNDKDPETTLLEEFMITNVVTVQEEDDLDDVVRKMSDNQVRRIPVVDSYYRLQGLISLGDVAVRSKDEHESFEALEHISEYQPRTYRSLGQQ